MIEELYQSVFERERIIFFVNLPTLVDWINQVVVLGQILHITRLNSLSVIVIRVHIAES